MAKVLGVGGIFFESPDPKKLCDWYAQRLEMLIEPHGGADFKKSPKTRERALPVLKTLIRAD
jgi:hypothetical protein